MEIVTRKSRNTKLNGVYWAMVHRCHSPSVAKYKNYGARGISVCDEWRKSFQSFKKWAIEAGYSEGLQIDRIDNFGDYSPGNCRWVTCKQNNRNRRTTILVSGFGETKSVMDWAEDLRCEVKYGTLFYRLRVLKWDLETSLSVPPLRLRRPRPEFVQKHTA